MKNKTEYFRFLQMILRGNCIKTQNVLHTFFMEFRDVIILIIYFIRAAENPEQLDKKAPMAMSFWCWNYLFEVLRFLK